VNPLTCHEVRDRIELYAADECDPDTHAAVASHLEDCPGCTEALEQACELLALLDLQGRQDEQLTRLKQRLRAEARPRNGARPILRLARRFGPLAAMLLLTFGLLTLLPLPAPPAAQRPLELTAVLAPEARVLEPAEGHPRIWPGRGSSDGPKASGEKVYAVKLAVDKVAAASYRKRIQSTHPPLPPRVNLSLRLNNPGSRPLRLLMGGQRFLWRLDLRGPGARTVPVRDPTFRPFAKEKWIIVPARGEARVPIERLVSRWGNRFEYSYWTAPGEYTLRAEIHTLVEEGSPAERSQVRTFRTGPVRIVVKPPVSPPPDRR
jgi:hypothetical protein